MRLRVGDKVVLTKESMEYYEFEDPCPVLTISDIHLDFPDEGEVMYSVNGPEKYYNMSYFASEFRRA